MLIKMTNHNDPPISGYDEHNVYFETIVKGINLVEQINKLFASNKQLIISSLG